MELVSKIENGKAKPTIDTLGRICEVLDFDMANLFAGSLISLQNYKLDDISQYFQRVQSLCSDFLQFLTDFLQLILDRRCFFSACWRKKK